MLSLLNPFWGSVLYSPGGSPSLLDVVSGLGCVLMLDMYTPGAYVLSGSDVVSIKNRITDTTITATGTPQYNATGLNGGPSVDLSGTGQYFLGSESAVYAPFTDANAHTLIVVAQSDQTFYNGNYFAVGNSGVSGSRTRQFRASAVGAGRWSDVAINDTPTTILVNTDGSTPTDTSPHIHEWSGSTTATFRLDRAATSIAASAHDPTVGGTETNTPNQWAIGARPDSVPDNLFDGDISLVLAFPSVLSAGNLDAVYTAMSAHHSALAGLIP